MVSTISVLIPAFAVLVGFVSALPSVSPNPDSYKHVCETTSSPDIPCFHFWRSDLKDAILGDELNKDNLFIKDDDYIDFAYTDVNQPFSILFNEQVELLYGGRNAFNCTQFYVSKQFRHGAVDFATARVLVADEDGHVLHDSDNPQSGWMSNCKKWTHIKVWHG